MAKKQQTRPRPAWYGAYGSEVSGSDADRILSNGKTIWQVDYVAYVGMPIAKGPSHLQYRTFTKAKDAKTLYDHLVDSGMVELVEIQKYTPARGHWDPEQIAHYQVQRYTNPRRRKSPGLAAHTAGGPGHPSTRGPIPEGPDRGTIQRAKEQAKRWDEVWVVSTDGARYPEHLGLLSESEIAFRVHPDGRVEDVRSDENPTPSESESPKVEWSSRYPGVIRVRGHIKYRGRRYRVDMRPISTVLYPTIGYAEVESNTNVTREGADVSPSARRAIIRKLVDLIQTDVRQRSENPIADMPGGSVSGCIKKQKRKPKGKRPRDAGAYCAAIADRIEPGWRSENPRNDLPRKIGESTEIVAHGHTLRIKKHSRGTYFLQIDGQRHARWGNSDQARQDITHFRHMGALPREKVSWNPATFDKIPTHRERARARRLSNP